MEVWPTRQRRPGWGPSQHLADGSGLGLQPLGLEQVAQQPRSHLQLLHPLLQRLHGRALGSGRIVASETEAPTVLESLVWSGWAAAQRDGAPGPGHDLVLQLCGRRPDPLEVVRGVAQRRGLKVKSQG